MWKKILYGTLGLSFVFELVFAIAGFAGPAWILTQFQLPVTPETLFLAHVLAWMLLFVALTCGLALKLVAKRDKDGWTLSYLLGLWWIGIGLALFIGWGRIDNLVMDTVKGAIIFVAAWQSRPRQPSANRAGR